MLRRSVGRPRDVPAVEQHRALARRHEPGDDVEERGLAAARRAEQRIGAALAPDMVDRASARSRPARVGCGLVGVGEVLERDLGHARLLKPPRAGRGGGQARPPASNTNSRAGSTIGRRSSAPGSTSRTPGASATKRSAGIFDMDEALRAGDLRDGDGRRAGRWRRGRVGSRYRWLGAEAGGVGARRPAPPRTPAAATLAAGRQAHAARLASRSP